MKIKCGLYLSKLLLALWLCLIYQSLTADEVVFESIELEIAGEVFNLEVARTLEQKRLGLMYRTNLAEQSGMIFPYAEAGDYRIWMKNTLIPLTVIWFDEYARVIDIKKLAPCRQRDCPVYGVDRPSKFIIEFNIHFNGLKPGDRVPALLTLK